jgi:hypothetical protein
MQNTTLGLDLAKHRLQVHGVDASGAVAIRRKRGSDLLPILAAGCRHHIGRSSSAARPDGRMAAVP